MRPNDVITLYNYDVLNRVTEITHGDGLSLIDQFSHTYDAAGNRNSVHESDGTTLRYEYDERYRLTAEHRTEQGIDATTTYTYDDATPHSVISAR